MTISEDDAREMTHQALARGVTGDMHGGAELLIPLMTDSYGSAYALACMLSETAAYIARRDQAPGFFTVMVDNIETGESGSADDLPPEVAFAARFVTAWANRDQDMTEALFKNLVNQSGLDGEGFVEGLIALFQLAVATSTQIVEEQRAARARAVFFGNTDTVIALNQTDAFGRPIPGMDPKQ